MLGSSPPPRRRTLGFTCRRRRCWFSRWWVAPSDFASVFTFLYPLSVWFSTLGCYPFCSSLVPLSGSVSLVFRSEVFDLVSWCVLLIDPSPREFCAVFVREEAVRFWCPGVFSLSTPHQGRCCFCEGGSCLVCCLCGGDEGGIGGSFFGLECDVVVTVGLECDVVREGQGF